MKKNHFVKFFILLIIILTSCNSCKEKLTEVGTENIVQIVYENVNVFLITKEDDNTFSTLSIYNKNLDKISSISFQGSFIDSISNNTIFASINHKDKLNLKLTKIISDYKIVYNTEIIPAAKIDILIDSFRIDKESNTIIHYQRTILNPKSNLLEYINDSNIEYEINKGISISTSELNIFDLNKIIFKNNIFHGIISGISIIHGNDFLRYDLYFLSKNDYELYKKAVFTLCLNSLKE